MGRSNYGIEKGLDFYDENGDAPVIAHLFGAGAPGGDTGPQDDAGIGSTYNRTNGSMFRKTADNDLAADWVEMVNADLTQLSFRSELVRAGTVDTVTAGTVDVTGFSDNEKGLDGNDFAVGEHLLGDIDGTPALFRVTVVTSATDITVVAADDALADNDTFTVRNWLPDVGATQEEQALVLFNGSTMIKIGDFNWNLADGIGMNGFSATSGVPSGSDSVQTAIEKVEKAAADLVLLSGVARNATDLGTFAGDCIADNRKVKEALSDLEACIEALESQSQATAVTAVVTLDSVVVDDVLATEWEVHMREDATPANVKTEKIMALHNGTASADANDTDDTVFAKTKLGGGFNTVVAVDLNGAAGSQVMRLRVSSSSGGVTFSARRTNITG